MKEQQSILRSVFPNIKENLKAIRKFLESHEATNEKYRVRLDIIET